jgi:hypothetical protein
MGRVVPTVDDLLAAPVGVVLLDRLEAAERPVAPPFWALADSDPAAVDRATRAVGALSSGRLLHVALGAADHLAGPWSSGAPGSLALAYELAPARRALAELLWARFREDLVAGRQLGLQEHWTDLAQPPWPTPPGFTDLAAVYGNGEFTFSGLWTVSPPPDDVHDDLVATWEMYQGEVTRWRLPVRPGARVWGIDHPADWVALVERYPRTAARSHAGWELPGPNQSASDVALLASAPGQHAVRTAVDRHVLPDWRAVACDYDGVHLSWAGFLTAEGFVSDLPGGGVTMLRYWGSERTLWLADVFGEPEPLGPPVLSGRVSGVTGTDVRQGNPSRLQADRAALAHRLNRPPAPRPSGY